MSYPQASTKPVLPGHPNPHAARQPCALLISSFPITLFMGSLQVCDTHKIDPPGTAAELTKDQAFEYLEKMMTIRRMETSAGEL